MAGNLETTCVSECSELSELRKENYFLKEKLGKAHDNGTGDKCPSCGVRMIHCSSRDVKECGNGHTFDYKLKPKQKSDLIDGLVGGLENAGVP